MCIKVIIGVLGLHGPATQNGVTYVVDARNKKIKECQVFNERSNDSTFHLLRNSILAPPFCL